MDPTDPKILEPLDFLPEDRREKIVTAGGIAKLLVSSGQFAMQGKLICPIEELGVVAASMTTSNSAHNNRRQPNKDLAESSGGHGEKHIGKSEQEPTTVTYRASGESFLGSLLPPKRSAMVQRSSASSGLLGLSKTKQPDSEAGSKWNTSVLIPKPNSPSSPDTSLRKEKKSKILPVKKSEEVVEVLRKPRLKDTALANEKSTVKKKVEGAKVKVESLKVKVEPPAKKSSSRGSSKDSSRSGSGNEGGSGRSGVESSGTETEKRDMFSPTNSTSSMSSESSSNSAIPPAVIPPAVNTQPPPSKKSSKKKKKNSNPSAEKNALNSPKLPPSSPTPSPSMRLVTAMVQTDAPLVIDKWVMTDTVPPVENFKERYEAVVKEKKDLQQKLERSEDQRFKLQKSHKREVEQLLRQTKQDVKEVRLISGRGKGV